MNKLVIGDCTVLAGNLPWPLEEEEIIIQALKFKPQKYHMHGFGWRARTVSYYNDGYIYDTDYINNLTVGNRYVFVGRYEPLNREINLYLWDPLTEPWCEAIQSVENKPEKYLETPDSVN